MAGYGQGAGASVEEVRMTTILGIDAAWTATGASGVALVASARHGWRCIAIAPSYDEFYSLSRGRPVTWIDGPDNGSPPNVSRLLSAARTLSRTEIDLVAVDMPVATVPIVGRRVADRDISTAFGGRGCSTHSPNISRPGALGARLMRDLSSAGYSLATGTTKAGTAPRTIEVYPHPALLALLGRSYRIPYKVENSNRYWPKVSIAQRKQNLLAEFQAIDSTLAHNLGPTGVPLALASPMTALSRLKRFEDALDALICAWVGTRYIAGAAVPYGDGTSAIWVP